MNPLPSADGRAMNGEQEGINRYATTVRRYITFSQARRADRRRVLGVTIFFCCIWLTLGSHSFWSDLSGNGTPDISNNSTSPEITGTTGGQGFRHWFMNCVSLNDCPWFFDDLEAPRNQVLEAEAVHLEPEHLALPRMRNPYPDFSKWSLEKKAKALKGLNWLIDHYDARWLSSSKGGRQARALNVPVFRRIRDCINRSTPKSWLSAKLRTGEESITCSAESMTIVLGTFHFAFVHDGSVSGEDIWARSSIAAFTDLGYSMIYAIETLEMFDIYWAIPDLVHIIIAESNHIRQCYARGVDALAEVLPTWDYQRKERLSYVKATEKKTGEYRHLTSTEWMRIVEEGQIDQWFNPVYYGHPVLTGQRFSNSSEALNLDSPDYEPHEEWRCAQSPDFEQGIPLWKMLAFHFWASPSHPLGAKWTLSPEPYKMFPSLLGQVEFNFYLGYSIEAFCGVIVPPSERMHRAFVYSKRPRSFQPPAFTYSKHVFSEISENHGFEFVAAIDPVGSNPLPAIKSLGRMPVEQFMYEVGHSKVLLGIGTPLLSPTPYDALCMGVPFIQPILVWDAQYPDDQTKWKLQHEGLSRVGEPYVYNIRSGNKSQLEAALVKAFSTPIERFVPSHMTRPAVKARHRILVETDWKAVYDQHVNKSEHLMV